MQEEAEMKPKEQLINEKQQLAEDALRLAKTTLGDLEACISEASVRDLLNVFNSALKAHRELTGDLLEIARQDAEAAEKAKESQSERDLSKQYNSKVDELLKSLKTNNSEQ